MIEPTTLGALFRRTGDILVRRWPLYSIATVVAFAIQAGLLLWHHLDPNLSLLIGEVFAYAPLSAIVFGFGAADCAVEPQPNLAVWGRIAERIWAVVFIDAALYVLSFGLQVGVGTSEIAQLMLQVGILILSTMLAFAEVHAIAGPDAKPGRLLLESLLASVRITTTRIGYARAVGLVFVPFLAITLLQPHLWPIVVVASVIQVPVAALSLVFYLDCIALGRASLK